MDTLLFALNAILPIILLIFLGYLLKRKNFLDEDWFKKGNKLIFRVCLPCMLFVNVYNIESFTDINWSVVVYSEIAIFAAFFLGLILVKLTVPDHRQKGVILQCVFRSNFAIIGLPLAESLGGAEGKGIAAVLSAFSIPTFNILAVLALTMFLDDEDGHKANIKDVLLKIVKNPLIIGVVCGLVTLGIRSLIPVNADGNLVFSLSGSLKFLYDAVNNLSRISSPLALVILGGLFDFAAVKGMLKEIVIGTAVRVAVVPLVVIGLAVILSRYTGLISFDATVYPALIALFGSPVAVSSAIMAQEMDNDGILAGQLVVWTSIASIFTTFLAVFLLRTIGLL
ncbi:MAG: AEC family transporter [Lachnospiraceae bacterium]|nr:AEC family transporter [Lachnospiraceae bacterium]MCM1240492.1 AEC family transporter [Lachnospiraceae bacterium]